MLPRLFATLIFCVSLPAETVQLIPQTYYRTFAHTNPVLKRIRPGDVVVTKTLDSGGQDYKNELIKDKVEGDEVSVYRTGDFLDLCRGPHVKSTKELKAFKLLRVAGAYWRGDEKQPQLTRIYGTAWPSQRELELLTNPRVGLQLQTLSQAVSCGAVAETAKGSGNLLVPMKAALKEMATLGEVADVLRGEFGVYQPGG